MNIGRRVRGVAIATMVVGLRLAGGGREGAED